MARRFGSGLALGGFGGIVVGAVGALGIVANVTDAFDPDPVMATVAADQQLPTGAVEVVTTSVEVEPVERTVQTYGGHGAWVDVFDYDPAYAGEEPAIAPDDVDDMAAHGVETLYLQSARLDDRTPDGLVSPLLLYQFLERAHANDIEVVAWYLPKLGDVGADLTRIELLDSFGAYGQQFDGIALDIEDTTTVPDVADRNARLVDLSRRGRALLGDDAFGAIVLPPVLTEVVNTDFWPDLPYPEIADAYDVWLPMSYWTQRTGDSGYQDGFTYNDESTRRLRDNLGDPDALVHGIGGLSEGVTVDSLEAFLRSLVETESIGGSLYDWATLSAEDRATMAELFADGPGADLPDP